MWSKCRLTLLFSFICRLHICNSNHCNHQQFHHVGIGDGETSNLTLAFINIYDLLIYLLLFVVKKNIETIEVVELITLIINTYKKLYFKYIRYWFLKLFISYMYTNYEKKQFAVINTKCDTILALKRYFCYKVLKVKRDLTNCLWILCTSLQIAKSRPLGDCFWCYIEMYIS